MVRVTNAILALSANGRVAGVIAVDYKVGQIIRRRYRPEGQTPKQAVIRDNWRTVDLAWQSLTRAEKDQWNAYQSWRRSWGYNRFMSINIRRGLDGEPLYLLPSDIP